eukprot:1235433-Amphidinium_carterae.1
MKNSSKSAEDLPVFCLDADVQSIGRLTYAFEEKLTLLLQLLPGVTMSYYRMRMERTMSRPAVKRGFASSFVYVQVAVAVVFLRCARVAARAHCPTLALRPRIVEAVGILGETQGSSKASARYIVCSCSP